MRSGRIAVALVVLAGPVVLAVEACPAAATTVISQVAISSPGAFTHYSCRGALGATSSSSAVSSTGTLWFAEPGIGMIGELATTGALSQHAIPDDTSRFLPRTSCSGSSVRASTYEVVPDQVIAGSQGTMWFSVATVPIIGEISPSGTITEYPIPTAGVRTGSADVRTLVAGSGGGIWFSVEGTYSSTGVTSYLGQITASGSTELNAVDEAITGIASGPDGSVWAELSSGVETGYVLERFTPSFSTTQIPAPRGGLSCLTDGPEGSLWAFGGDGIVKVSAAGSVYQYKALRYTTQGCPIVGPDGRLWYQVSNSATGMTEFRGLVAISSNGASAVYPVPVVTGKTYVQPIDFGHSSTVAAGTSGVWFTNYAGNEVGMVSVTGAVSTYSDAMGPLSITSSPASGTWFTEVTGNAVGRIGPAPPFDAFTRIWGPTPDATAAKELEHRFTAGDGACPGTTSDRPVVLATDSRYPDALASAYLARVLGTGTLLTPASSLSAPTLTALRAEGITHVYVVGGPLAITTGVVGKLESTPAYVCGGSSQLGSTLQVTRVGGTTEYTTAADIAEYPGAASVGSVNVSGAYAGTNASGGNGLYNDSAGNASAEPAAPGDLPTAILAAGKTFQDAESASTLAYAESLPILLTTTSVLSQQATAALSALGIKQVIVMGGQLAVSNAVVSSLERLGVSVLRVAGATYGDTAVQLAGLETASGTAGLGWKGTGSVAVARGDFFTDGLAGAVVAADGPHATSPEPLLLTIDPTTAGTALAAFLHTAGTAGIGGVAVSRFTILGGPLAVTQDTIDVLGADLGG